MFRLNDIFAYGQISTLAGRDAPRPSSELDDWKTE